MSEATIDWDLYRARIAALADKGIFVGTSSWKYQGWIGQLYTRSRYEFRGRFASSRFEKNCLAEYAETFRSVCYDAAYFTWPDEKKLVEMADQVPDNFKFAFKVTDLVTLKRFPSLPRFGAHGGMLNENFLNPGLFADRMLGPLNSIRSKVGPIILEFSKFYPGDYASGADFIGDLDKFFGAIPKGWPISIELRNKRWLGPDYLACLQRHGVAHTFNNWTDMPAVAEQIGIVGDQKIQDLTVARFLLKPGRKYEESVAKFEPYTHTQEVNEEGRTALAALIEAGWLKPAKNGTYLYINNRLEGNALMTVLAVLERLKFVPVDPKAVVRKTTEVKSAEGELDFG